MKFSVNDLLIKGTVTKKGFFSDIAFIFGSLIDGRSTSKVCLSKEFNKEEEKIIQYFHTHNERRVVGASTNSLQGQREELLLHYGGKFMWVVAGF